MRRRLLGLFFLAHSLGGLRKREPQPRAAFSGSGSGLGRHSLIQRARDIMSIKRFEAFEIAVELITQLRPLVALIAQHDRDLAEQIKRAGSSIPLNLAE